MEFQITANNFKYFALTMHLITFSILIASFVTLDWNLCRGSTHIPIKKCGIFHCCSYKECRRNEIVSSKIFII